jgi:hypothetical protein
MKKSGEIRRSKLKTLVLLSLISQQEICLGKMGLVNQLKAKTFPLMHGQETSGINKE